MTPGDARSHEAAARYACGVIDTISRDAKDRVMGGCAPKELYSCVEQFMPFSEGGLAGLEVHSSLLDAVPHEKPPHMKIPK
jgi:hypothetical protein